MTGDERLHDLHKVVTDQAGELLAMDILLRALIASHPKPEKLKLALEVLSERFAEQIRNHGFSTKRDPNFVLRTSVDVHKHLTRWLQILAETPAGNPKGRVQ